MQPIKIWDLGKQIGVTCTGDEDDVIRELEYMEQRDSVFKQ